MNLGCIQAVFDKDVLSLVITSVQLCLSYQSSSTTLLMTGQERYDLVGIALLMPLPRADSHQG